MPKLEFLKKKIISFNSFLLYIYFFLSPLESFLIFSFGSLLKFYTIFLILIFLLKILYNKKIELNKIIIYCCILILILFISLLFTDNVIKGIDNTLTISLQLVLIICISQFNYSKNEVNKFIFSYILGCSLLAIFLISGNNMYGSYTNRYTVTINNISIDPNGLAAFFSTAIFFLLGIFQNSNIFIRLVKTFLIIVLLFACLLTNSRGGLLAILCSLIYIIFFSGSFKKSISIIFYILLLTTSIIFLEFGINKIHIIEIVVNRIIDSGDSGRIIFWKQALFGISDNLFTGVGIGGSPEYFKQTLDQVLGSHNTYITFILELGILGILFPLGLFYSFILGKAKLYLYTNAALVSCLTCIFFIDSFNKKFLWIPLILCILDKRKDKIL